MVSALELLCSPELVFKDYCDYDLKPLMEASVNKRNISMVSQLLKTVHVILNYVMYTCIVRCVVAMKMCLMLTKLFVRCRGLISKLSESLHSR